MATGRVDVVLGVQADVKAARQQIETLVGQLDKIQNLQINTNLGNTYVKNIEEAKAAAIQLKAQINAAFNPDTGKLNLNKFNKELVQSGATLQQYHTELAKFGPQGEETFRTLANSIVTAEAPILSLNDKFKSFGKTLMNTAKWQLSSTMLHGLISGISSAYNYAKDLNESLNSIRIVTGQSVEQMAKLAEQANRTAQALSTSTLDYTNASLIYYQQGLDDSAVQERTETTLKLANVTGQSASEISSYMTAIWNNFDNGTKSLEYYADAITALGASTASSSEEIATGLSKFAAIADTVGLSYEYATAALATVVAETRQSADTVGTAFRTIFSRLEGLSLGETLDDGTDLNKYSQALATVGVSIKDSNGNLKEMDQILDELGAKWQSLTKDQQVALAQTVGGVRQYTNLIALMDNYDKLKQNVVIAQDSEGTLQQQQDIYAESWEAASKRSQAALQNLYDQILNDDAFIKLTNVFAEIVDFTAEFIKNLGGVKGLLLNISAIVFTFFQKSMASGINNLTYSLMNFTKKGREQVENLRTQASQQVQNSYANMGGLQGKASSAFAKNQAEVNQEYTTNASKLDDIQRNVLETLMRQHEVLVQNGVEQAKIAEQAEKQANREADALKAKRDPEQMSESGEDNKDTVYTYDINDNAAKADAILNDYKTRFYQNQRWENMKPQVLEMDNWEDAVDWINKTEESLAETGQTFESAFGDNIGNKIREIKSNYEDFSNKVKNGEKSSEEMSEAMTRQIRELNEMKGPLKEDSELMADLQKVGATVNQTDLDNFKQGARDSSEEYAKLVEELNAVKAELEMLKKYIQEPMAAPLKIGEQITTMVSSVQALAMALNSVISLKDIWTNDDLSVGEKLLQTIMSLSMAFMVVSRAMGGQNLQRLKSILLTTTETAAVNKNTKAQKENTGARGENTAATEIQNDSKKSGIFSSFKEKLSNFKGKTIGRLSNVGSFLAAGAAVAAVAAALITYANSINETTEEKLKRVNQAETELKTRSEETKQAYENEKTALDDLTTSVDEYNEAVKGMSDAVAYTDNWKASLQSANEAAREMIATYDDLKGRYHVDSNGLIVFDQGALEEAKSNQQNRISESYNEMITAENAQNQAENDTAITTAIVKDDHDYNPTLGIGGAAATGALIGSVMGPLGMFLGGLLGAAVGGLFEIVGINVQNDSNKKQEDALNALADAQRRSDKSIYELLHDNSKTSVLSLEDQALINSLGMTEDELSQLCDQINANNKATLENTRELIKSRTPDEKGSSSDARAAVGAEMITEEAKRLKEEYLDKDIDELAEMYKQAKGYATVEIDDDNDTAKFYDNEGNEVGTFGIDALAGQLAQQMAEQITNDDIDDEVDAKLKQMRGSTTLRNLTDDQLKAILSIGTDGNLSGITLSDLSGLGLYDVNKFYKEAYGKDLDVETKSIISGVYNLRENPYLQNASLEAIRKYQNMDSDQQERVGNLLENIGEENLTTEFLESLFGGNINFNSTGFGDQLYDLLGNYNIEITSGVQEATDEIVNSATEIEQAGVLSANNIKEAYNELLNATTGKKYSKEELEEKFGLGAADIQQLINEGYLAEVDGVYTILNQGFQEAVKGIAQDKAIRQFDQNNKDYNTAKNRVDNNESSASSSYTSGNITFQLADGETMTDEEWSNFVSENYPEYKSIDQYNIDRFFSQLNGPDAQNLREGIAAALNINYDQVAPAAQKLLSDYAADKIISDQTLDYIIGDQRLNELIQEQLWNSGGLVWGEYVDDEKLKQILNNKGLQELFMLITGLTTDIPNLSDEEFLENYFLGDNALTNFLNMVAYSSGSYYDPAQLASWVPNSMTGPVKSVTVASTNGTYGQAVTNEQDAAQNMLDSFTAILASATSLEELDKLYGDYIKELPQEKRAQAEKAYEQYAKTLQVEDVENSGLDIEEWEKYKKYLMETNKALKNNEFEAGKLAKQIMETNKAIEQGKSDWEKYGEVIKQNLRETEEFGIGIESIREDLAKIFGEESLQWFDEEWITQNTEALEGFFNQTKEGIDAVNDYIETQRIKNSDQFKTLFPEPEDQEFALNCIINSEWGPNGQLSLESLSNMILSLTNNAEGLVALLQAMGYTNIKLNWETEGEDGVIEGLNVNGEPVLVKGGKLVVDPNSVIPENIEISGYNKARVYHPSSSSSGGGGGSSKEKKNSSDEIERYHVLDKVLQSIENDLDRISDAKDDLWGAARLNAIDQETAALQKQLEVYDQYEDEILGYLAQDKANIAQYGAAFDEYGNISNYDEIMQQQLDKYNSSLTDEAEQEYEAFKEYLDQYEETLEKYYDNQADRMDVIRQMAESELEKITYAVEIQVEIDDNKIDEIDRLLGKIEDRGFKAAEAIGLMADKADPLMDKITKTEGAIQAIFAEAEANKARGWFLETGGFSADMKEQLDDYKETLSSLDEDISTLISDIFDAAEGAIDEANEKLDLQIGRFDSYSTVFDNYVTMMGLLGKTTANAQTIINLGNQKVENSINKLSALQAQQQVNEANLAAAQQAYLDAVATENEEIIERAAEQVEQLTVDVEQRAIEIESALSEVLQTAADNFSNTANQIADVASKALAGLYSSLDQMSNWYENAKTKQDIYVSETERLYQLNKMNRDILKSIDETDNVAAKTKLRDLQKQINQLLAQGNKMTQYDLDKLQAQYEVRQAQIALEEAQNAKNQVRLVRNAEGGFGYVYTADQDSIDSAQQNYEDKLYNLQKLAEDRVRELSDMIIENEKSMIEAMRNLRAEDFANEADYQAELNRIVEYYTGLDLEYRQLLDSAVIDSGITWSDTLLSQYENTRSWSEGHSMMVGAAEDALGDLTDAYGTWQSQTQDALTLAGYNIDDYATQFETNGDRVITKSGEVKTKIEEEAGSLTTYVQQSWEKAAQFFTDYGKKLSDMQKEVSDAIDSVNSLVDSFNNLSNAVGNVNNLSLDNVAPQAFNPTSSGGSGGGKKGGLFTGDGTLEWHATRMGTTNDSAYKGYRSITLTANSPQIVDVNGTAYMLIGTSQKGESLYMRTSDINSYFEVTKGGSPFGARYSLQPSTRITSKGLPAAQYQAIPIFTASQYASGGYTGEFGPEGRLAVLHEKELVLNKKDTENFLNIVQILRDLQLQSSIISRLPRFGQNLDKKEAIQQNVTINAEFPDATDRDEIAAAFQQLASQSSQYILQSGR